MRAKAWQGRRSENVALLCLLVLLAATAAGAYSSIEVVAGDSRWMEQNAKTLSAMQQASARFAEMETLLRAYEDAPTPANLSEYRAKVPQVLDRVRNLRAQAGNDPGRQAMIGRIDDAARRRIAGGDSMTEEFSHGPPGGRRRVELADADAALSMAYRTASRALLGDITRRIDARSATHRSAYATPAILVALLSFLAAGGVMLSFIHALRNIRKRERADVERNQAVSSGRDAEARALTAEQRAIETFDSISDGLFIFDREFNYLYVNPRGERIVGRTRSELIGRCVWNLLPEKLGTDFERVYRGVMASRTPGAFEAQFPNSSRWLEVRAFPNRFTGGITVFFRDITELKAAREEQAGLIQVVCQANDLLHGIMEGSHDLICSIDLDYCFTAMNEAYRSAILAMSGVEARTGMKVKELNVQQDLHRQISDVPWRRALRGMESTVQEQFALPEGVNHTYEVRYCSIRDHQGGIVGASAIARDITSRLQAELALVAAHELLNTQMQRRTEELHEKETLLREVHHRVKNNMQVISSLLSMQRKLVVDDAAREAFQQSENRIQSMAMIHESLYQQSKFSSLELAPYLRRLADHLAASYGKTNVECRVVGTPAVLNLEKAIPCGLIVNELISNCFKHAFPGGAKGSIEVDVRHKDGHVTVSVSDNGAGLPAGFQLIGRRSLGLKVVHTLATRQLHGKLEYSSGGGARFAFEFDEAETEEREAAATVVV